MPKARVAINGRGDVRLDFMLNNLPRTILWEHVSEGVLESHFDLNGAILLQRPLPKSNKPLICFEKFKSLNGIKEIEHVDFEAVFLNRNCPNCDSNGLSRHVELYRYSKGVPVMPLYRCKECLKDSYYLTDAYLDYLVKNNMALFESEELALMQNDSGAFKKELKGNIISIFASKKIRRIV